MVHFKLGWATGDENRHWCRSLKQALANQKADGLGSILTRLAIFDVVHVNIPFLYQIVASAISRCEALEEMKIMTVANGDTDDLLDRMGLVADKKVIGLRSLQQFASDEELQIVRQYRGPLGEVRWVEPFPQRIRNAAKTLTK